MQMYSLKDLFFFYDDCAKLKILPNSIEHAYMLVLQNDLSTALEVISKLESPRAKWCKILISILNGYMEEYPTYFQIRNFLEIDLDLFIKNKRIDYVENILGASEILITINIETYKYIARVMYENSLEPIALQYMNKSRLVYYNDAELHFLYSKYYYKLGEFKQSIFYLKECLRLIPDYCPAIELLQKIEENCI